MTSSVAANWFAVVGLVYAAIGVVMVATALRASALLAGAPADVHSRYARSSGACAGFGAVLAAIGFFLQAIGQFRTVELGPVVAALLVGLIGLLALYALADFSTPSIGARAEAAAADAAGQQPSRSTAPPSTTGEPTIKLVTAVKA